MARYSTRLYGEDNFYYGDSPQLALSIEPFEAVALDYSKVLVTWTSPIGDFVRFRLVRNQDGIPDTEEDGVVLLDIADLNVVTDTRRFMDGVDNTGDAAVALVQGSYVHYAIWLLLSDNTWEMVGSVSTLVAAKHERVLGGTNRTRDTHAKLMDLLPRVYTSSTGSPIDEVDQSSDLYNFLYSFSYTIDELLTFIDLLLPNHLYTNFSKEMLNVRAFEYGFTSENRASTRFQRRLVREANYITSRKGTKLSLETLVESMTGYIPVITASPNLILSSQDSTFRGGIGSWIPQGACTIALDKLVVPSTAESHNLDAGDTAKVVVTTSGAKIVNGVASPVTRGIPVVPGTEYTFSSYAMADSSSKTFTKTVNWHDRRGVVISSSTSSSKTAGTSWAKFTHTATAPEFSSLVPGSVDAVYATIEFTFTSAATFHLDMLQFAASSVTKYYEARGVQIVLEPTKKNFITNPSFENATYTAGWTFVGTTSEEPVVDPITDTLYGPPGIFTGQSFVELTGGVGGNSAATSVTAPTGGVFYSFSIYVKSATGTGSLEQTIQLTAEKSGLTTLTNSATVTAIEEDWARVSINLYIPVDYAGATLTASLFNTSNTTGGIQLEAAQLEIGFKPTDYFDGSYSVNGGEWEGGIANSNNAVSYMFQNKGVKMYRLREELPRYLPIGTAYTVESQDDIEFSGWA